MIHRGLTPEAQENSPHRSRNTKPQQVVCCGSSCLSGSSIDPLGHGGRASSREIRTPSTLSSSSRGDLCTCDSPEIPLRARRTSPTTRWVISRRRLVLVRTEYTHVANDRGWNLPGRHSLNSWRDRAFPHLPPREPELLCATISSSSRANWTPVLVSERVLVLSFGGDFVDCSSWSALNGCGAANQSDESISFSDRWQWQTEVAAAA